MRLASQVTYVVGYYDGMPNIVRALEHGIDRFAGPKAWQQRQKRTPNNVGN